MFDENRRRKRGFLGTFLTVVLASLGVGALLFIFTSGYFRTATPAPQQTPQAQTNRVAPQPQTGSGIPQPQQIAAQITGAAPSYAGVARSAIPGVVGISVLKVDSGSIFDKNTTQTWGVGSGVIVSPDGYILTNNHVAGGTNKRIVVSLHDGRSLDGTTTWADPVIDLAVVKINATGLPTIPFGDSNTLQVGDPAIAIGNPLGLQLQRTVTSGIISALNRTIKIDTDQGSNYMEDLIQTDASINPGNSGGPLLNANGQVIGINTVKVTSAEGLGFAVPINVASPVVNKFVQTGTFKEPYMGVFAYDKEIIPYMDNTIKLDAGIYVSNVDNAGPAYKAGLRQGCVITQVDGNNITTMAQLRSYIYSKNPGDTINVTHLSNGKTMTVPITLAQKNKDGLITR